MPQPKQPQSNLAFTTKLLAWFDKNGRKNLPWQNPRTPYHVWVSEVMLQQTQVKTVIPYFERFITRFPTLEALAKASEDEILAHWAGLGYYSRGRNLQKAAQIIVQEMQSCMPSDFKQLVSLPGIGESTAAAILSLAFNQPAAILDGNVKRILSRYFLIAGNPEQTTTKKIFKQHAENCLPQTQAADYTQAIMDLGALVCTPKNPSCPQCPVQNHCLAHRENLVAQYPEKPPKKTRPTKEAQFILLHDKHQATIYLEKRPAKGIWGGLWSLPSLEKSSCAISYVEQTHGLQVYTNYPLPYLEHIFTHFKLQLYPRALGVQAHLTQQILPKNGRWVHIEQLGEYGLAKPIQMIIEQFIKMDAALPATIT